MSDIKHRAPFVIVADGMRRVWSAPAILLGTWILTALLALRPAAELQRTITSDLGASMAASSASAAVNLSWWQEFVSRQPAFADSFQPYIIGFGAVLANLSMFVSASSPGQVAVTATIAYVVAWMFLIGGILDRYARQRRTGAHGFFAASGVFFFRFLRLGVLAAMAWAFVFGAVHAWLFGELYPWLTRETTVERTAFAWYVALTLLFVAIVAAVMVVFDYAKVRSVVEDRRSMLGALVAGTRFVRRHPGAVASVFAMNAVLFGLVLTAYGLLARGAAGGDAVSLTLTLVIAQLFILGRLFVKLSFYASAVSLFQDRLAHAAYTAAPEPVWPESPAIETIVRE